MLFLTCRFIESFSVLILWKASEIKKFKSIEGLDLVFIANKSSHKDLGFAFVFTFGFVTQ